MSSTVWKSYQEVGRYLLNQFAEHFNIGRVEGEQRIQAESGTYWNIDAKGIVENGEGFVVVECRRHTTRRIPQGYVGQVAYIINDTGAQGGIIVSPFGFQAGAKKVAESSNIIHVTLDPQSTTTEYIMQFLDRIAIGVHERLDISDRLDRRIRGPEGDSDFSV